MNAHISEVEYDYLLTNWDRKPEVFLQWASHVCGGSKNTIEHLSRLIKNEEDLSNWIELFDGDLDKIEETSILYIQNKTE